MSFKKVYSFILLLGLFLNLYSEDKPSFSLKKTENSIYSEGGLKDIPELEEKAPFNSGFDYFGGKGPTFLNNGFDASKHISPTGEISDQLNRYIVPGPYDFKVMIGTDWNCFLNSWRLKGVGMCRRRWKIKVCLKLEHHWPTGLVETHKKFGDSYVKSPVPMIYNKIMSKAASLAMRSKWKLKPGSGSGHNGAVEQTHLHVFDANVYLYPDVNRYLEELGKYNPYMQAVHQVASRLMCNPGLPMAITPVYNTQSDFLLWRTGIHDIAKVIKVKALLSGVKGCVDTKYGKNLSAIKKIDALNQYCIGNYGPIYPRTGRLAHFNEPTASAVVAFRAISMAHRGGGLKTQAYRFNIQPGSMIQQLEPANHACSKLEGNFTDQPGYKNFSRNGKYLYAHYPLLECCGGCYGARQIF